MTSLSAAALAALPVPGPRYDRSGVTAGIVHLGVGGFHRSHEAVYVDRLLAGGHLDWGICGVGVLPHDRRMRDVLREQDGLYTLLVKHPHGSVEAQVVGSLVDYLFAPDDPEAVVERMAAPSTRIVSLTITEGGYQVDPVTQRFTPVDPAVLLDAQQVGPPTSVFGMVVAALSRRRERGLRPFTVLSCDNVQDNGAIAREAFSSFAGLCDPELGAWVRDAVRFPSSMVDRITPVTTDADRALLAEEHGLHDGWPVVCEPFLQWVLQDDFGDGRPPWEDVGVQLVDDVHPYELMKLRLLNAGHQAIGYLGALAGHRSTDDVLRDPDLTALLSAYLEREASPTLPPVPGIDLPGYRRTLLDRFANPYVRDSLARLCAESSDRIPTFLLPVVRDQLAAGRDVSCSALVVAAWARYARGRDESGEPLVVVDRLLETVAAAAEDPDPRTFLEATGVFGDLATEPRFVRSYLEQYDALVQHGARAAARAAAAGG